MKHVLIATEKPFSKAALDKMIGLMGKSGLSHEILEKYTDVQQLKDAVKNANALIVRSDKITKEIIEAAPNLEIIVRAGAGYDNIDLQTSKDRGIIVENTPGQNANAVAELVIGMLISHVRHKFCGVTGSELRGKKLGIHGFGAVGKRLAVIGRAFGMYVHFSDRYVPFETSYEYGVIDIEDVNYLYKACQFISIHVPLTVETSKMVDYDLMISMPENAVLINSSRPEVIDEDALVKVMEDRQDFSYIADVAPTNRAYLEEKYPDRVYFTPKKCGAQTEEANNNAGIAAVDQIAAYFATGEKKFQVNR